MFAKQSKRIDMKIIEFIHISSTRKPMSLPRNCKSASLMDWFTRKQVQPDMEELTDNAEEHDEEGSKQSEQKLGKLQYKVWCQMANLQIELTTNSFLY